MLIDIDEILLSEGKGTADPTRHAKVIALRQHFIEQKYRCGTRSPTTNFQPCQNVLGAETLAFDKPGRGSTLIMCGKCIPKCLDGVTKGTVVIGPEMDS